MTRYLLVLVLGLFTTAAPAATPIVANGLSRAEIVTAESPSRSTAFAARELQTHLKQLSGADIAIVSTPSGDAPVKLFVGTSPYTQELGLSDEGLDHGAYRLVSGEDWLAFIGQDVDFVPKEPYAHNRSDWENRVQAEWDQLTGHLWRNRLAQVMFRNYNEELNLWRYDKTGSANAVYAWLQELGVRWYMPGDLGTIIPQLTNIELPKVDRTVHPDMLERVMCFNRYQRPPEPLLWARRLGITREIEEQFSSHGIRYVTEREDQKKAHPEFFQLIAGERHNKNRKANACLSSEALLQENLRYLRFMFDYYDELDYLGVSPHDGLTRICECDGCKDQATIDRGYPGWLSDYVWGYIVRVANELAKTHPDKKIMCGAYSTYQLPPLSIDKLPDNVMVQITNGRPRYRMDDERHAEKAALRQAWLQKTSNPLSITMNYPFTQRGVFKPTFFPHVVARSLRDVTGQVWREDIWIPEHRDGLHEPGVNHLTAYMISQFWWDSSQDVEEILGEYYRLYYGPAEQEMKAFIELSQRHFTTLHESKEQINQLLDLFATAKDKVSPDSVYGQRIALIDSFLDTIRSRRHQLDKDRGPVPEFRAYNLRNPKYDQDRPHAKLDGKLDELWWTMRANLNAIPEGATIEHGTRFQVVWADDAIMFGIRCEESGEPVITTTEDEDPTIWTSDHVEILLETNLLSYYQIVINPAGAHIDLDRSVAKTGWYDWLSNAEVGTHIGDGFWSMEVKIPVTNDTNDPLNMVIGDKPSPALPWFFNICRKRVRGDTTELSAFNPPPGSKFHDVMSFGKIYSK